jgi:hypothetical protein
MDTRNRPRQHRGYARPRTYRRRNGNRRAGLPRDGVSGSRAREAHRKPEHPRADRVQLAPLRGAGGADRGVPEGATPVVTLLCALRFSEVADSVPRAPGIYEIHTLTGLALKVGIGDDVRERLIRHGQSRQSGLKFKTGSTATNPCDVDSKRSILAKHLYFDATIDPRYDMRTELGRQRFLEEQCRITVEITATRAAAREIEKVRERRGTYRYCGDVIRR